MNTCLTSLAFLALGAGISLAITATADQQADQPSDPKAASLASEPIELTDQQGRVRIRLGVREDGTAVIETLDTNGTARAALSTSTQGTGSVDVYDTQGRPRIAAFTFTDNEAGFQLLDPDGTLRCSAVSSSTGQHWFRQFDGKGRLRMSSGGPRDGNAALYFFDEAGLPIGLQVMGAAYEDRTTLAFAKAVHQHLSDRRRAAGAPLVPRPRGF